MAPLLLGAVKFTALVLLVAAVASPCAPVRVVVAGAEQPYRSEIELLFQAAGSGRSQIVGRASLNPWDGTGIPLNLGGLRAFLPGQMGGRITAALSHDGRIETTGSLDMRSIDPLTLLVVTLDASGLRISESSDTMGDGANWLASGALGWMLRLLPCLCRPWQWGG